MNWIIPALVVPILYSLSSYFQKGMLSRSRTSIASFLLTLTIAIMLIPTIPLVQFTHPLVPILYISSIIGTIGFYFTMKAIKSLDLSESQPLISSLSPIATWLFALLMIGEEIKIIQIAGLLLISLGSLMLETNFARERFKLKKELVYVLVAVAAYSVASVFDRYVLTHGMTIITHQFLAHWFITINLGLLILATGRRGIRASLKLNKKDLVLAAVLLMASRMAQVLAVSLGPVSMVIAIKRLSALVSVVIGGKLLGERYWEARFAATLIMIVGVILLVI